MAQHLVEQLPDSLDRVLTVLWHCLGDMRDDLSSSVGAVMDLLGLKFMNPLTLTLNCVLGKLVTYDKVINILANEALSYVFHFLFIIGVSSEPCPYADFHFLLLHPRSFLFSVTQYLMSASR